MDGASGSRAEKSPLGSCLSDISAGLPADVSAVPWSPELRARYAIERVLAAGGMGVVFLARHLSLARPVALKFLATDSEEMRARFLREAAVLAAVSHPHVLRLLDHGEEGGLPYHAVEYLPGGTLAGRIAHRLRLPPVEAMDIAQQMLSGLAACHQKGIVHRDLKPDNVLFGDDGTVRIADLGIAHDAQEAGVLTRTGMLLGTPRYMAPEQARGEAVTQAADLYAAGAILYHMLGGQPPFTCSDPVQLLRKQILEPAPPLDRLAHGLPAGLAELVHRALAKSPAARPRSATAFAEELAAIRSGLASDGTPRVIPHSSAGATSLPPRRSSRTVRAIALAAVLPLVVAAIALVVRPRASPPPSPPAPASAMPGPVEPAAVEPEAALRGEARALGQRLAGMPAGTAVDERRALMRRFLARARTVLGPRCGRVLTPGLLRGLLTDANDRARELRNEFESSAYTLLMEGRTPADNRSDYLAKKTEDFELLTRDLRDLAPAAFAPDAEPATAVLFAQVAQVPMKPSLQMLDQRIRGRYEAEAQRWLREYPTSWIGWYVEAERQMHDRAVEAERDARVRTRELLESEMNARGGRWDQHLISMWLESIGRHVHALTRLGDKAGARRLHGHLTGLLPRVADQPEPVVNAVRTYLAQLGRFYK